MAADLTIRLTNPTVNIVCKALRDRAETEAGLDPYLANLEAPKVCSCQLGVAVEYSP